MQRFFKAKQEFKDLQETIKQTEVNMGNVTFKQSLTCTVNIESKLKELYAATYSMIQEREELQNRLQKIKRTHDQISQQINNLNESVANLDESYGNIKDIRSKEEQDTFKTKIAEIKNQCNNNPIIQKFKLLLTPLEKQIEVLETKLSLFSDTDIAMLHEDLDNIKSAQYVVENCHQSLDKGVEITLQKIVPELDSKIAENINNDIMKDAIVLPDEDKRYETPKPF
jgi:chromosome segregation ATPase